MVKETLEDIIIRAYRLTPSIIDIMDYLRFYDVTTPTFMVQQIINKAKEKGEIT